MKQVILLNGAMSLVGLVSARGRPTGETESSKDNIMRESKKIDSVIGSDVEDSRIEDLQNL